MGESPAIFQLSLDTIPLDSLVILINPPSMPFLTLNPSLPNQSNKVDIGRDLPLEGDGPNILGRQSKIKYLSSASHWGSVVWSDFEPPCACTVTTNLMGIEAD